jgi:hypothetical protein
MAPLAGTTGLTNALSDCTMLPAYYLFYPQIANTPAALGIFQFCIMDSQVICNNKIGSYVLFSINCI